MRGRVVAALAAVLLLALAPMSVAAPVGGEQAYLVEQGPVQRSGFWGSAPSISDAQVLSIGYTVCELHARGLSDVDVLAVMAAHRPPPGSRAYEVGLDGVRDAIRYLC